MTSAAAMTTAAAARNAHAQPPTTNAHADRQADDDPAREHREDDAQQADRDDQPDEDSPQNGVDDYDATGPGFTVRASSAESCTDGGRRVSRTVGGRLLLVDRRCGNGHDADQRRGVGGPVPGALPSSAVAVTTPIRRRGVAIGLPNSRRLVSGTDSAWARLAKPITSSSRRP